MSTLIDSLNEIYTTKLQIKEVIGTQSDVFSDYPAYIAAAIGTGGGVDWDEVAAYGYIVPSGTVTLGSNGTVDVSTYANAYVNVPQSGGEGLDWDDVAQAGYIVPAGTKNITSNGNNIDISTYATVNVNVPQEGGSSYYYPVHTVSDVTEFSVENSGMPYMWQWSANELDGESGDFSSAAFTNKYWGYCYPQEIEIMENPVLNFDDFGMGFSMVSYTDLVKREFTYNTLPDFNTYRGYTYSYQYLNPEYDPELWNDEYLTYEFYYGENLLYKTALNIVTLSDREIVSPGEFYNGVCRVYDSDQVGLIGYYDESEMGEGNYVNQQLLSIGCLSPAETDGGPVTQFTTSYHGAASYLTGFDPRTLCGYTWSAVVDGNGWLVDLVSKGSQLLATEMRLTESTDPSDIEQAAYLSSGNNEFTQEIELSDQNAVFDGYFVAALIGNKYYETGIPSLDPYRMYGENNVIPATGTLNDPCVIGSPNLYVDMSDVNNYYSTWSMTITLHIPNNFYKSGNCYWTWSFSGTPISQ